MQSRTFRVIPGLQSFDKCLNAYCARLIYPALMESYTVPHRVPGNIFPPFSFSFAFLEKSMGRLFWFG